MAPNDSTSNDETQFLVVGSEFFSPSDNQGILKDNLGRKYPREDENKIKKSVSLRRGLLAVVLIVSTTTTISLLFHDGICKKRQHSNSTELFTNNRCQLQSGCFPLPGKNGNILLDATNKCSSFYPKRFFFPNTPHKTIKMDMSALSQTATKFHEFQHDSVITNILRTHRINHNNNSTNCLSCRNGLPDAFTYCHIHKNGGTTITSALRSFANHSLAYGNEESYYRTDEYNFRQVRSMGPQVFISDVLTPIMANVYRTQLQTREEQSHKTKKNGHESSSDEIVFSFVRDPVHRFLSSVGEVLHQNKFKQCQGDGTSSRDMLRCMINLLHEGPEWEYHNVHFHPQALELYLCVADYDVRVDVMDISKLSSFVRMLGEDGEVRKRSRSHNGVGYSKGFNLSLSVLDEDLMEDVCRLYEMDVWMLRSFGMSTKLCDEFI